MAAFKEPGSPLSRSGVFARHQREQRLRMESNAFLRDHNANDPGMLSPDEFNTYMSIRSREDAVDMARRLAHKQRLSESAKQRFADPVAREARRKQFERDRIALVRAAMRELANNRSAVARKLDISVTTVIRYQRMIEAEDALDPTKPRCPICQQELPQPGKRQH